MKENLWSIKVLRWREGEKYTEKNGSICTYHLATTIPRVVIISHRQSNTGCRRYNTSLIKAITWAEYSNKDEVWRTKNQACSYHLPPIIKWDAADEATTLSAQSPIKCDKKGGCEREGNQTASSEALRRWFSYCLVALGDGDATSDYGCSLSEAAPLTLSG